LQKKICLIGILVGVILLIVIIIVASLASKFAGGSGKNDDAVKSSAAPQPTVSDATCKYWALFMAG